MDLARSTIDPGRRAPRLLLLVFGIFLVLVGLTASALVAITSVHVSTMTLNVVVERDRSLVDLFVNGNLTAADLGPAGPDAAGVASLRDKLDALAKTDEIDGIELRNRDGDLVASTGGERGIAPSGEQLATAMSGEATATLSESGDAMILEEHLPVMDADETVLGVMVLQRDATDLMAGLGGVLRDVMIITLVAALVLAGILVLVFRAAHARLIRQQHQLGEAARRDALTGMLNHGSIVSLLADTVETARSDGEPIAVALVDVDNFRLFNDTHGHDAADAVLLKVADAVTRAAGPNGLAARYGPDELILVRPGQTALAMEESIRELQAVLREVGLRFGDSEELPVSVSIGVAAFPLHAGSVTALLSEVSGALAGKSVV